MPTEGPLWFIFNWALLFNIVTSKRAAGNLLKMFSKLNEIKLITDKHASDLGAKHASVCCVLISISLQTENWRKEVTPSTSVKFKFSEWIEKKTRNNFKKVSHNWHVIKCAERSFTFVLYSLHFSAETEKASQHRLAHLFAYPHGLYLESITQHKKTWQITPDLYSNVLQTDMALCRVCSCLVTMFPCVSDVSSGPVDGITAARSVTSAGGQ